MKGKKVKIIVKLCFNWFLILLGTFILALGASIFLVPFSIISGGVSGFGILMEELTGLAVDIWVYIITWSLFLLGTILLGFKFTLNTLISTIFYPIFLSILIRTDVCLNLVNLLYGDNVAIIQNGVIGISSPLTDVGKLLIIGVFGGVFIGVGCGLSFIGGGSTGGLDILAFILNKYTGLSISAGTFLGDGTIVFLGLIFDIFSRNGNIEESSLNFIAGLIGVISAYTCALIVDHIYVGKSSSYIADIISDKIDEINDFAIKNLDRSTTTFAVIGGYSKEEKTMIRIVFTKREYIKVKDEIAKIDPHAFVTYTQTKMVHGEGFAKNIKSNTTLFSELKELNQKIKNKKNGK